MPFQNEIYAPYPNADWTSDKSTSSDGKCSFNYSDFVYTVISFDIVYKTLVIHLCSYCFFSFSIDTFMGGSIVCEVVVANPD